VTLAPKGLLIEEQRTNLLTYSEQFDNAAWVKFQSATVSANAAVAPDGTVTADLLSWTSSGASGIYQSAVSAFVSSMSLYAKASSGSPLIGFGDDTGTRFTLFNLSTGTLVSTSGTSSTSITSVGNGWYRMSVAFATAPSNIKFITGGGAVGAAYIWGAQLEQGSFSTSYIPTVASQVTRAADSASMIGNNFARWYNQTAGTMYAEIASSSSITSGRDGLFEFRQTGGGFTTGWRAGRNNSNAGANVVAGGVFLNGATQAFMAGATLTNTNGYKTAMAVETNNFAFCVNAGTVATDVSGVLPSTIDQLAIGFEDGPFRANGCIKRIAYYPRRLANTELTALTS
jgi:hypothetical protein